MDTSDLAKRMKDYEFRNRYYLQRRMPVIIRCDMRAGHTYTEGFKRPFDEIFIKTMQETAKYMCKNIQNCRAAYIQSDEITLILIDYEKLNTDDWFGYRIDKICSISASMATMAFNKEFEHQVMKYKEEHIVNSKKDGKSCWWDSYKDHYYQTIYNAMNKGAMFDARCFNIPKEEVVNLIYWRQLDASRNSIQMVGQANFSHKELQNKSCNDIQDMLMTQKGINWNDFPTYQKRGSCCVKTEIIDDFQITDFNEKLEPSLVINKYHTEWIVDKEIPIFKGEGREYIDRLIFVGEE